jgi:hypothetical protein
LPEVQVHRVAVGVHATRTFSAQLAHIKLTLSLQTMPDSDPVQKAHHSIATSKDIS